VARQGDALLMMIYQLLQILLLKIHTHLEVEGQEVEMVGEEVEVVLVITSHRRVQINTKTLKIKINQSLPWCTIIIITIMVEVINRKAGTNINLVAKLLLNIIITITMIKAVSMIAVVNNIITTIIKINHQVADLVQVLPITPHRPKLKSVCRQAMVVKGKVPREGSLKANRRVHLTKHCTMLGTPRHTLFP